MEIAGDRIRNIWRGSSLKFQQYAEMPSRPSFMSDLLSISMENFFFAVLIQFPVVNHSDSTGKWAGQMAHTWSVRLQGYFCQARRRIPPSDRHPSYTTNTEQLYTTKCPSPRTCIRCLNFGVPRIACASHSSGDKSSRRVWWQKGRHATI